MWTMWTECSASCAGGNRNRQRECLNGNPGDSGCLGNTIEMGVCSQQACAAWTMWTVWMPCSVTCGSGYELYRRDCNEGVEGDIGCEGSRVEYRECGNTVSLYSLFTTFFKIFLWKLNIFS